jgi:hypothetical protein
LRCFEMVEVGRGVYERGMIVDLPFAMAPTLYTVQNSPYSSVQLTTSFLIIPKLIMSKAFRDGSPLLQSFANLVELPYHAEAIQRHSLFYFGTMLGHI